MTGVKIASRSKKMIMIGLLIAAAVIVAIFSVTQMQKKKAADAAKAVQESEAAAAEEALANYSTNFELAVYSMLSGAGEAETCGNLIKQVWYNAIYEESDITTDKYTRPNGYYVSDFNDALQNLFSDSSFSSQISGIEDNQDTGTEKPAGGI